jgi:hypothetical protein
MIPSENLFECASGSFVASLEPERDISISDDWQLFDRMCIILFGSPHQSVPINVIWSFLGQVCRSSTGSQARKFNPANRFERFTIQKRTFRTLIEVLQTVENWADSASINDPEEFEHFSS